MPNWCSNNIVVTGAVEDIANFTQTCIRPDEKGKSRFDFNGLIPMPKILEGTVAFVWLYAKPSLALTANMKILKGRKLW
jgi:hypothetical protein